MKKDLKDILKLVSPAAKKDFLSRLQSGQYVLGEVYDPQPSVTFELITGSTLFRCKQDGRELSKEEISALPGYMFAVNLVDDKDQVAGKKLPSEIILIPHPEIGYLNSLLKLKDNSII